MGRKFGSVVKPKSDKKRDKKVYPVQQQPIIELLTQTEVCRLIGVSFPTFKKMLEVGAFPPPSDWAGYRVWRKEVAIEAIMKLGL